MDQHFLYSAMENWTQTSLDLYWPAQQLPIFIMTPDKIFPVQAKHNKLKVINQHINQF